jgi:hypothetical protein
MSGTDYHRTVSAALSETSSKFTLAEALATDIPPRRGRPARNEAGTDQQLSEAREQITEAGGEPRSVSTLRNYRLTALWVKDPKTGSFRWLKGCCWSAHDEARQRGLSYGEFAALPPGTLVETVRDIFREPPPEHPEQDSPVPVTFLPPAEPGLVPDVRFFLPRAELGTVPKPRPESKPEPKPRPKPESKRLNLVTAFRELHRSVKQVADEVASHGTEPAERDELLQEVTWLTVTLTQIRKDIRAGNLTTV